MPYLFVACTGFFLPLLIAIQIVAVRAGAQRIQKEQPKPALLRLIDGNLRQAVYQYKILMGHVPADRLPEAILRGQVCW